MATPTRNLGLNRPDFNESPWHDEVNDNFDAIDAAIHALTGLTIDGAWTNSTLYLVGTRVIDTITNTLWECAVEHTSAGSGLFSTDRTNNPTYWTNITINSGVDSINGLDGVVTLDTDDVVEGTNNKYLSAANKAKLDNITITGAVDLDAMSAAITALDSALIYKGVWDASSGSFPGAGVAQSGWVYTVSVGGTVDSIVFNAGDRITAIVDNASTTVFNANWFKQDYTDQVSAVFGRSGAVVAAASDYDASQIDNDSQVAGTFLDDALNELNKWVMPVIVQNYVDASTELETGNGQVQFFIPSVLNGMNLIAVEGYHVTAGSGGGNTTIQIRNTNSGQDMLSSLLTIGSGSTGPGSATIDTDEDDVATGDRITIDIDAVTSTPPKGLVVFLTFQLPAA